MSGLDPKEAQPTDILARLIAAIHRSDDLIEILAEATKQLTAAVKCDHVNILFNNEQSKYFYINPALSPAKGEASREVVIPYNETSITEIIRSQRSVVRDDLTGRGKLTHGDLKFLAEGIKSDLSTPIICRNRVYAVIHLSSYEAHFFTEEARHQTEQIAALLALVLERTDLIEKIHRQQTDLMNWKIKFDCLYHHIDEAVAIIRWDDDLIYDANIAFQRLTGFGPNELHGMRLSRLHPQQEAMILSTADKCSKQEKRKTISQLHLIRKDGIKTPVRLHFVYLGGESIQLVLAIYEKLINQPSFSQPEAKEGAIDNSFYHIKLSALAEIIRLAESDLPLDGIIRAALLNIKKVMAFDFAQIGLFDNADENVTHYTMISERYRESDPRQDWQVLEEGDFFWYNVSQQNLKQQFAQLQIGADGLAHRLLSRASTVLLTRDHCRGTLLIGHLEPNCYQEDDVLFLKQIAASISLVIEHANFAQEHIKNQLQTAWGADFKKTIGTNWEINQVLSSIVKLSATKMSAQLATVQLLEHEKLTSGIIASEPECNKAFLFEFEKENVVPALSKTSSPFIINMIPFDELEQLQCSIAKSLSDCITSVSVPLKSDSKIIGVLSNYWNCSYQLSPADQVRMTVIAALAADAIDQARIYQETIYRSERLAKAREELEKTMDAFLHHQKAPLVSIQGFTATLLERLKDEIPDDLLDYLKKIKAQSINLQQHIDALSELARVGQIVHPLAEFKIVELVENTNRKFAEVIRQKNIKISVDSELPAITGDRNLIQQAFSIIIENVINSFDEHIRRPKIEIGYRCEAGTDIIVVRNNGIGIRNDLEGDLFDLFKLTEGQETVAPNGRLNLAIARKIFELHDGQLWLESAAGRGSSVCMSLPHKKF